MLAWLTWLQVIGVMQAIKVSLNYTLASLMTGHKNRALQVPPVVPYKALGNFPKALYRTTGGTCSARFFRPVMVSTAVSLQFLR